MLYVGSATDAREVYVGLTRHRADATVVVERDRLEAAARVSQADPRLRPSDAELRERLYIESRRYGEKRNVVDHVEDRAAFVRTGTLPPPRPERALDIRRGFEAGRRLRAVMREVAATPRLALWRLALLAQGVDRRMAANMRGLAVRLWGLSPMLNLVPAPEPARAERERHGSDLER